MYNTPMRAQSAIAKLLESMRGGATQPTPPFNPNAPPPPMPPQGGGQGLLANAPTPEQMLAQQLSQNADRGYLANQGGPPQAPPPPPPQGLLAGPPQAAMPQAASGMMEPEPQGRGNLFQPAMDPALAARMAPEDVSRATPSVLRSIAGLVFDGQSPRAIQRSRAEQIIADRDDATARAQKARDEATLAEIRQEAMRLYPTDPQAQVEYVAQSSAARIGGVTQATQAAVGLRERAPQRVTWTTVPMMVNGAQKMVMRSNDGQLLDASTGADLREPGNTLAPMPPNPPTGSFGTEASLVGPNGRPMVMNRQTGRMEEAPEGVTRAGTQSTQEIRVIDNERSLAYNDAQLSMSGLLDANGKMKEPPSNFDRAATRSEWTNALASNEGQAYMNNVRKLIRSWVVLIEGKRMSDADARVNELQRSFAFGDGPDVIASKKATLESMAESIRALGNPRSATTAPAAPPQNGQRKPTYEEWLATQGRP